ncbi:hypothetical protein Tco_0419230 [Tanacetum coccineum]
MEGIEMTKQERESMLYDEFDKFTSEPGESIHSYYLRFAKLINDINNDFLAMKVESLMQRRFEKSTSVFPEPLALLANTYNPPPSYSKQCTARKKVKDSEWFKEKMLLAQAQEAEVVLDEEQQYFLADSLEETDDCEDLQLQATTNFKADHVDAYDSDTLILAERVGCNDEKQLFVNTKLIDYSKLNKLYEIFVPQTQLSAEQLYWSSIPSPPVNVSKPKVFPEKLPSSSQVLRNLNKARDLLTKFDECIKRRTTLSPHKFYTIQSSRHGQKTKLQTDSLQQKLNDQIFENNKLRAQFKGNFSEYQMNHNGTSVNTQLSKPLTLGTKLYSVTLFPKSKVIPKVAEKNDLSKSVTSHLTTNKIIKKCTKILAPCLLKMESEPINAYFKNNRAMHRDYLKVTKEHVATLHELLEEARALKPLDEHIGHASKFAERIQELLVYVSTACPFTQNGNEKWA